MNATRITCPAGTYGLAVEPWTPGEVYAVAADWARASSPVLSYGYDGWTHTGRQVADYRHRPKDALRAVIMETIALSEGIPTEDVDEYEVGGILASAVEI